MVKPVTPTIIEEARPNVDAEIERINAILSQPWSNYECTSGRCITPAVQGVCVDEIIRVYQEQPAVAGWVWVVTHTCGQLDGNFLRFRREAVK